MTQPVIDVSPTNLARMMLAIIENDRERLERIDRYMAGDHDPPYMPEFADEEYRLLAKRSISNWTPLLVNTPAQACYVDSFRRGPDAPLAGPDSATDPVLPEWVHWQRSRLDALQLPIHRGALKYGHAYTLTERVGTEVLTKGLSALWTSALYEDPANDINPYCALTIVRMPDPKSKIRAARRGLARMWDRTREYKVTFAATTDLESVQVRYGPSHGLRECPVTRFVAQIDLEGRTVGVVEPWIPVQDRINQTMFDLLVAQTYGSFNIRVATGMAPPVLRYTQAMIEGKVKLPFDVPPEAEVGDPVIDPATGYPVPAPVNMNARRWLFFEDEKADVKSLDATPLEGYIRSLDMSIRHMAAITQTPPHYLLGEIANLSAEALQAAETSLLRKVEEYRKSFGESWERVFRLAALLSGADESELDMSGEVIWRDVEMRPLSATADGLAKLAEGLGIPKRGLWSRVPNNTRAELVEWVRLAEEERQRALKGEDIKDIATVLQNLLNNIQSALPVPDDGPFKGVTVRDDD